MKNTNLPIYLATTGLIIFLAAIGWQTAETKHFVSASTRMADAPMPNLDGEKAKEYLAQNNLSQSLNKAVQAARYSVNWVEHAPISNQSSAFEAKNLQQEFAAYFSNDGVNLVSREANENWNFSLKLKSYGRGGEQWAVGSGQWTVNKTRVSASYQIESQILNRKSNIDELFENKPEGLEHSFIIKEKIEDQKPKTEDQFLKIALTLSGDLHARAAEDGQSVSLVKQSGETVLRYDKLKSWDANGKELASRMELDGDELSLVVDDTEAVYPVTIDPTFTQVKKLLAADGAANDIFGSSIAMSGNTAVISAVNDNDAQGSAYVFERNSGGANNWDQVKKLTASDGAAGDNFGRSVAIDGNTVVVGSDRAAYVYGRNAGGADNWSEVKIITEDIGTQATFGQLAISVNTIFLGVSTNTPEAGVGPVFVYDQDQGGLNNWGEVKQLTLEGGSGFDSFPGAIDVADDTAIIASNGSQGIAQIYRRDEGGVNNWGRVERIFGGFFPAAVGISGDTAVIGALAFSGNGEAHIYGRNTGGADSWDLVKTITASDGAPGDSFGISVGISNDRIIVGASLDDVGANTNQGSAYIFERNQGGANNWGEIKKISAADGAADDRFGVSVVIDGNTAFAGTTLDDVGSNIDQGAAYVFVRSNDTWNQETKPLPANCTVEDFSGSSVAISGDTVIVGAINDDVGANANQGAALIFQRDAGGTNNWGLVKTIAAVDGAAEDRFGNAVAINGDTAIIGAYPDDTGTNINQGSAYIFERNSGGANNWGQVKKLTASDGADQDWFGWSVSISGNTAIVGAISDDVGANNSQGSAYIFERNAGGPNNWGEVKHFIASDGAAFDTFGKSVAISGDTAIVGSDGDTVAGIRKGSVYIVERNIGGAGNWGELKKITAADGAASDQFGYGVAIDGNTIIVGAWQDKVGANVDQGSAYIFERNTGGANNWGEVKRLVASDGAASDYFGLSVSISGDTAIVSAPYDQIGANTFQGSAYIFKQNMGGADNWGQAKKLTATDGAENDVFGLTVAVSGETAIAGAPGDDVGGALNQGSASIFVSNNDAWDQQANVSPPPPTNCGAADNYGFSVAVSGDTAVIGAPGDDVGINANQGSVYILERNQGGANKWGLVKLLTASDGAANDLFGRSVAISGNSVIVGADGGPSGTNTAGSAYIFERNTGGTNNFGEVKELTASDGVIGDRLGWSVAINGNAAVVGAIRDNNSQGSAYIYERNQGGANNWGETKKLVDAGGAADDFFGWSVVVKNDTIFVSSPTALVGANDNQGSVHIFERNAGGANNWARTKYLTVADGTFLDSFGWAIAVSGNLLIATATGDGIGDFTGEGSAYIFERNTGGAENWGQVKKIRAADAGPQDQFGRAVGISGDAVIVGTPYDDVGANENQGSAYIFEQNAGGANNWGQVKKLTATDGVANDVFGYSVAVSGDTFLVGAYFTTAPAPAPSTEKQANHSLGEHTKGAGYVFRGNTSAPTAASATITGTIADGTGARVAGVVINLSGTQNRKTITDASGNYRFANVETSGFYTVTPGRANYSFDPASRSFSQLGNTTEAVFTGTPNVLIVGNPVDTPEYFVRQHYLDFLGREPDEAGFNFWSDQMLECGVDVGCLERRRINVSAAYFLSIEFQETGGLVDGLYRASYARRPLYAEFMADSSAIARGVVVGRNGWQQQLETNKQAFVDAWVQRAAFIEAYGNLSNDGYVDQLIAHTGANYTASERDALVTGLTNATLTRAAVLRRIVENQSFASAKFNEAFVMMQYFGYLRRDPDESGYQFWLRKLNEFNGNFEQAEMVKAFISSSEYRQRFSSP